MGTAVPTGLLESSISSTLGSLQAAQLKGVEHFHPPRNKRHLVTGCLAEGSTGRDGYSGDHIMTPEAPDRVRAAVLAKPGPSLADLEDS